MLDRHQEIASEAPRPAYGKALRDQDLYEIVAALRRYAMALVRDPTEADDLVQESLARAVTYNPEGIAVRDWRPYLFSILHNVFVDQRSKIARMREFLPINDLALQFPCPPNQEAHLELRELVETLAQLPDEQREAVLLAGLEGLSYKEVAKVINAPIGTVMSRLSRGRQQLRSLMDRAAEPAAEGDH